MRGKEKGMSECEEGGRERVEREREREREERKREREERVVCCKGMGKRKYRSTQATTE